MVTVCGMSSEGPLPFGGGDVEKATFPTICWKKTGGQANSYPYLYSIETFRRAGMAAVKNWWQAGPVTSSQAL